MTLQIIYVNIYRTQTCNICVIFMKMICHTDQSSLCRLLLRRCLHGFVIWTVWTDRKTNSITTNKYYCRWVHRCTNTLPSTKAVAETQTAESFVYFSRQVDVRDGKTYYSFLIRKAEEFYLHYGTSGVARWCPSRPLYVKTKTNMNKNHKSKKQSAWM